jgi:hypothetical protein
MAEDKWSEVNIESSETWDRVKPVQGLLVDKKGNVGDNASNLYVIETADGNVSVWGSAVLDSKFSNIKVGTEVKVEYLGKVTNPKTKREYNDFKVYSRELPMTEVVEDDVDVENLPF